MSRPSMANTPAEVAAIFESLPGRFRPDRAADVRAVYHWTIDGAARDRWTVEIADAECRVRPGHEGQADCSIAMSEQTFLAIETGRRNPVMAFVKGKIKVSNVGAMRRYDRAFFRFHDIPEADASP
jgi:putative sterol carrier protein